MSKKDEALKLALEALEESLGYVQEEAENAQRLYGQYPTRQARIQGLKDDARKQMNAITAIREALAEQPAQEDPCPGCRKGGVCRTPKCGRLKLPADHPFRSEQPAQQQEPVARVIDDGTSEGSTEWIPFANRMEPLEAGDLLYTSPPASKPLTDEQIAEALGFGEQTTASTRATLTYIARAIEAAHGIKGDA